MLYRIALRDIYPMYAHVGESWGMANTFLLRLINTTYMHDLKSLVYNHKEQVKSTTKLQTFIEKIHSPGDLWP